MGSQMGKTEGLLNVIGHKLDDDPAPVLYVGPTKSNIDGVIEPRVEQMLKSASSLWSKTVQGRKAQKHAKRVAGVSFRLAWAGSATELASQPAHTVLVDEVDRMEPIPGEGDAVTLAEARIATYPDGRLVITSSPTEGNVTSSKNPETGVEHWDLNEQPETLASAVWRFWQEGTRHEWAVPCPQCHDYFVPRFKLLHWPEGCTPKRALQEARLACPSCGFLIGNESKSNMCAMGVYLAPGQAVVDGAVVGNDPPNDVASFWVSGLMSPWVSFGERAAAWLRAVKSGDPEKIRTIINTAFGELYRVGGDAPDWEHIRELCQNYLSGSVPEAVTTLTAFVDVQKDRLVYIVRGWGDAMESWLIEAGEIWGDTSHDDVWQELEALRSKQYGGTKMIARIGIDSGYRPGDKVRNPDNQIYAFCRKLKGWAFPTKGRERQEKPLQPSLIDVTFRGRLIKNGIQLWHMDSDFFKSWVYARYEWPEDQPGGWHVPSDVTDDYCQQVTAEARVLKPSGHATWIRVRRENHFLDCEAGNVAIAYALGLNRGARPASPRAPGPTHNPGAPRPPAPRASTTNAPQQQTQRSNGWLNKRKGWLKR